MGANHLKVLVLDTSAFIMGFNPLSVELPSFSVPAVAYELPPKSLAFICFNTARECGRLTVRMPSPPSQKAVSEASLKLGERQVLSEADRQILALALDLKFEFKEPIIVSDDYSIQNVAEHLKLEYTSLATFGISHGFDWIFYCPACFKRYPHGRPSDICEICGTELKRKVLRKALIKRKI